MADLQFPIQTETPAKRLTSRIGRPGKTRDIDQLRALEALVFQQASNDGLVPVIIRDAKRLCLSKDRDISITANYILAHMKARTAISANDMVMASEQLKMIAETRHPCAAEALHDMGSLILEQGQDFRDMQDADYLMQAAARKAHLFARKGNTRAQFLLFRLLEDDLCDPAIYGSANIWLQMAASQGHGGACYILKYRKEEIDKIQEEAQAGNAEAQIRIADEIARQATPATLVGAYKLYQTLATSSHESVAFAAKLSLATMQLHGNGTSQDTKAAIGKFLELGSVDDPRSIDALVTVAEFYQDRAISVYEALEYTDDHAPEFCPNGQVPSSLDLRLAIEFTRMAVNRAKQFAEMGNAYGQLRLGEMYANIRFILPNATMAEYWVNQAKCNGNQEAESLLENFQDSYLALLDVLPIPKSRSKAARMQHN